MRKDAPTRWQIADLPFSVLVLLILVWFTFGILFKAPYSGFYFSPNGGEVTGIHTAQSQEPRLLTGDVLKKVGEISFEEYRRDSRAVFFRNAQMGDVVPIVIERNGVELTVPWVFPGLTREEFNARLFNVWWLAYIFWFFGSLGQLLIRPRDQRWLLFIAANYLTAIWIILGSLSSWHIWESSILLRVFTWLLLPVYLHMHWRFPRPFMELPKAVCVLLYGLALSFALAEFVQALPKNYYAFVFMLTLVGSVGLQIAHFLRQSDRRRDVFLAAFSAFIAFFPSIGLSLMTAVGKMPDTAPIGLFSLPFMPLAYFYVIYRRQLGGLEVRANRLLSLYAYLILFATALIAFVTHIGSLRLSMHPLIFTGSVYTLATTYIAITVFPAFQSFMEKRFFGVRLPYRNLQETFSSRITTSVSMPSLLQLLEAEVFPSLLVRQYAFMHISNGELKTLLTKNTATEELSHKCRADELTAQAGKIFADDFPCGWIRLILPLQVGDRLIGFWLLGQRDPDDDYPQAEIPVLQSLANQTAVALSNIQYTEQVRKMYQSDIERNEAERKRLALELRDSVLNELAVLRTSLAEDSLPPRLQASYEEVTHRLREIVSDLRPPMLMYGLVPALNELADNLMERNGDRINIEVNIEGGDGRLPQNMEQHLFRIAQEACENSLRHARAQNIHIGGEISSHKLDLQIADDGAGFDPQTELDGLIANRHFGLAGMVERAQINIASKREAGTKIRITWAGDAEHLA
jgi:signal transduction histidine kinase